MSVATYPEGSPEYFMSLALREAQCARQEGEVPIGAVAVYDGQIIGRGYNRREMTKDATGHAEMQAIRQANQNLGRWRLYDVDVYVTLEPCPMCSGAMINARIRHCYFGAYDPKAGTAGSLMNLLADERFNHQVPTTGGVLLEDASQLLKQFFADLRRKKTNQKRNKEGQNGEKNFS